jgi:hypothetical protein
MGAAMPAGLMLRNRMVNGFIPENQVLTISREGLAESGPVVVRITARAVEPQPGTFAGVIVRLDGTEPHDRTPADDPAVNPLSPGIPNFDFYSLEVVQRIGYDSFCPDNGVLIAKNKDKESRNGGPNGFNCFNWVIDAHPADINKTDYIRPDGKPVMRTIADYRQLNDALFHAGNNSGSLYEWEDAPNRLHFYIIDVIRNEDGILSYKLGIRSLDDQGVQKRGVAITSPSPVKMKSQGEYYSFTLQNTGEAAETDPAIHNKDISASLNYDIYRLSVMVDGEGWNAILLNSLSTLKPGETEMIPVYISHDKVCSRSARLTLTASSENDPEKRATSVLTIKTRPGK